MTLPKFRASRAVNTAMQVATTVIQRPKRR